MATVVANQGSVKGGETMKDSCPRLGSPTPNSGFDNPSAAPFGTSLVRWPTGKYLGVVITVHTFRLEGPRIVLELSFCC